MSPYVVVTSQSNGKGKGGIAFLFILLAILIGFTFSNHALNSHKEQAWNATKIATFMQEGFCSPQRYTCDVPPWNEKVEILYCQHPNKPNLYLGLVLAAGTEHVITGYAGTEKSWLNRCGHNH